MKRPRATRPSPVRHLAAADLAHVIGGADEPKRTSSESRNIEFEMIK